MGCCCQAYWGQILFSYLLSRDLNKLPKDQFSTNVHSLSYFLFFPYLEHRFFFYISKEMPTEFKRKKLNNYLFEIEKNTDCKEMHMHKHTEYTFGVQDQNVMVLLFISLCVLESRLFNYCVS